MASKADEDPHIWQALELELRDAKELLGDPKKQANGYTISELKQLNDISPLTGKMPSNPIPLKVLKTTGAIKEANESNPTKMILATDGESKTYLLLKGEIANTKLKVGSKVRVEISGMDFYLHRGLFAFHVKSVSSV